MSAFDSLEQSFPKVFAFDAGFVGAHGYAFRLGFGSRNALPCGGAL